MRAWIVVAGLVLLVITLVGVVLFLGRTRHFAGPNSPDGYKVKIEVSDTLGWGADFYADVTILDRGNREIVVWRDPTGQATMDGAKNLLDSMKWQSRSTLQFIRSNGDGVVLELPSRDTGYSGKANRKTAP